MPAGKDYQENISDPSDPLQDPALSSGYRRVDFQSMMVESWAQMKAETTADCLELPTAVKMVGNWAQMKAVKMVGS